MQQRRKLFFFQRILHCLVKKRAQNFGTVREGVGWISTQPTTFIGEFKYFYTDYLPV